MRLIPWIGFQGAGQFRERLEYPDLLRPVRRLADQFSPTLILMEYQAAGDPLSKTSTPIPGYLSGQWEHPGATNKYGLTPLIESGRVFLPQRARWIGDFLDEMSVFPSGLYSDQVDALSQALTFLKSRFDRGIIQRHHVVRISTGRKRIFEPEETENQT